MVGAAALRADDRYGNWIAQSEPLTPEAERSKFHLPPGFEIQLVACEPEIRKPINMAFDRRGRLWVTQSIEYPIPAKDDISARDTVMILDDFAPDGRAGRIDTFADHLNIPIGVLPTRDGAIVYSIPNLYRLTDTDGDGKADKRDVLVGPFMYEDSHGMVNGLNWGYDGWVYALHGYHNVSVVSGKDGHKVRLYMGSCFRFRPDGSHVERITRGQVNPFGLTLDSMGRMFTADCHSRPIYELLRGAWYPSFDEPHDGLGFGPESCDHDHGSTAIAGIVYYTGQNFPPEYRNTILTGNVVTYRLNHDKLSVTGSSSHAIHQKDFLSCDDPWFRPVDIKQAPDGSIYMADFYDRIIAHDEVPLDHPGRSNQHGRIWRIVYRGDKRQPESASLARQVAQSDPDTLIGDLAHPSVAFRMLAANELVARAGSKVITGLRTLCLQDPSPDRRAQTLWILERINPLVPDLLASAAGDADPLVRIHVMGILRERAEWATLERSLVASGLRDSDAFVQRAAVEAVAVHPYPDLLAPLFEARRTAPDSDPQLRYASRVALRDAFTHEENWSRWNQDAALRENGDLLADVATGVDSEASARFLLTYTQEHNLQPDQLQQFGRHISRFLPEAELPRLFEQMTQVNGQNFDRQVALVRGLCEGLRQRGTRASPAVLALAGEVAGRLLDTARDADFLVAAQIAQIVKVRSLENRLAAIAADRAQARTRRIPACDALVAIRATEHLDLLGHILGDGDEPPTMREHVVGLLGSVRTDSAVGILSKELAVAPSSLAVLIARALAQSKPGAQHLLDAVTEGKASAELLTDRQVNERIKRLRMPGIDQRVKKLTEGLSSTDEQLQHILTARKAGFLRSPGDSQRGAAVFQKNCAICHCIHNIGAKIGPELDGIGARGLDRLLEDTLEPSRNLDRNFRQIVVELKDGTSYVGLRRGEEGQTLVIADATGQTIVIPQGDIQTRWFANLSPMPSNIATDMPEKDYYDLLAFLLAQRQPNRTSQSARP